MKTKALLFLTGIAFAQSASALTFSGYIGISGEYMTKRTASKIDNDGSAIICEDFPAGMPSQSFFAGQLNLNDITFVRGELSFATEDVLEHSFFEPTDSVFEIKELSITRIMHAESSTHYLCAFMGSTDPIGSDTFIQRVLGATPICSRLTESWDSINNVAIYEFGSIGASYVFKPMIPAAAGFYIYYTKETDAKPKTLNFDLRLAFDSPYATMDLEGGVNFESDNEVNGEKVVFAITSANLHAGMNLFLGSKDSSGLFLQAGFEDVCINNGDTEKKEFDFKGENLFMLAELRFRVNKSHISVSAYNIPNKENGSSDVRTIGQKKTDKLPYINGTLGATLSIYSERPIFANHDVTMGMDFSAAFDGFYFDDLKDFISVSDEDDPELNMLDKNGNPVTDSDGNPKTKKKSKLMKDSINCWISPFMRTKFFNGTLSAYFGINPMHFSNSDLPLIKAGIGFKTAI